MYEIWISKKKLYSISYTKCYLYVSFFEFWKLGLFIFLLNHTDKIADALAYWVMIFK